MSALASAITEAVEAIRAQFAGHPVEVVPDGNGGVFVTVEDVSVGPSYAPAATWLGFQISAAYPDADVYPHYLSSAVRRHIRVCRSVSAQVTVFRCMRVA
ncbi:hypothetical protein DDQ41_14860 [Streptomyces spongiicola]|uniref:Uncharacterized protein n=1 Tax=Streptomyces spongiicola TaxID=1690221 RepID=A0ABM6V7T5_9ACTN|nr:hypothetical protein [Streptomyces spongiicola]AWK09970.1 hypothetical protein DDQ41_14860 [Streptomyces spongiicola]